MLSHKLILPALALLPFYTAISRSELWWPEEMAYSAAALQTAPLPQAPVWAGRPLCSPPLYVWCSGLLYLLLGPKEWVFRLLPLSFGLVGPVLLYALARQLYSGALRALLSSLLLASTLGWWLGAQTATTATGVACAAMAAALLGLKVKDGQPAAARLLWWLLFALLWGGLVGLAAAAAPALILLGSRSLLSIAGNVSSEHRWALGGLLSLALLLLALTGGGTGVQGLLGLDPMPSTGLSWHESFLEHRPDAGPSPGPIAIAMTVGSRLVLFFLTMLPHSGTLPLAFLLLWRLKRQRSTSRKKGGRPGKVSTLEAKITFTWLAGTLPIAVLGGPSGVICLLPPCCLLLGSFWESVPAFGEQPGKLGQAAGISNIALAAGLLGVLHLARPLLRPSCLPAWIAAWEWLVVLAIEIFLAWGLLLWGKPRAYAAALAAAFLIWAAVGGRVISPRLEEALPAKDLFTSGSMETGSLLSTLPDPSLPYYAREQVTYLTSVDDALTSITPGCRLVLTEEQLAAHPGLIRRLRQGSGYRVLSSSPGALLILKTGN